MATFDLKFGATSQRLDVADRRLAGVLEARELPARPAEDLIQAALARPVGAARLAELARPGMRVAIVASDVTRPAPSAAMLPPLLDSLRAAGIRDDDVTVTFGLGIHRPQSDAERARLVGESVYRRVRCRDSDPTRCVSIGRTNAGTPVNVDAEVAAADLKIATGNVEFHYFAGYSGGVKACVPGVSDRATIEHNHSMMVQPSAEAGRLDDNPVRRDLEEAGRMLGVQFCLDTVLNARRQIVAAVAGAPDRVVRAASKTIDSMYLIEIERAADVVVASAGGAPKDINLYQAQKALDNARFAVRPGGSIILVAECPEGFGEATFESWLRDAGSPEGLIERINRAFVLGGHKAAAIALTLRRATGYLVSQMDPADAERAFFIPADSAQDALDRALDRLGPGATVLVMPNAGSTLPKVRGGPTR